MYKPSELYLAALAYALERVDNKEDQIYILSAKHGLLSLSDIIEPYNETLSDKSLREKISWGMRVFKSLREKHNVHETKFVFLAGSNYTDPLAPYMSQFEEPLAGMQMGVRVSWMRQNTNTTKTKRKPGINLDYDSQKTIPTWVEILQMFETPVEIQTITRQGEYNLWISVQKENNKLVVGSAKHNQPSSNLSSRPIDQAEFESLVPYYQLWLDGSVTRNDITKVSQKSSYVFAIIHFILNQVRTKGIELDNNVPEWHLLRAKALRQRQYLESVPGDKPGWYRWWAMEEDLKKLLDSAFLEKKHFETIRPYLIQGEGPLEHYFCIYVGVAINESIQSRLNWHVNQKHSQTAVTTGFLSTLRQSISSLVASDQYNEDATNRFLDRLFVEYTALDYPINSIRARHTIENCELAEMRRGLIPINIKDNPNPHAKDFLNELRWARKRAKL